MEIKNEVDNSYKTVIKTYQSSETNELWWLYWQPIPCYICVDCLYSLRNTGKTDKDLESESIKLIVS